MDAKNNLFNLPSNLDITALPEPDLLTYYSNLNDRVIWLETDVDESWFEISRLILFWNKEDVGKSTEERKPIKLMFVSYGGLLDVNNSLVDIIELSKTPIWGFNMGYACSAGCFIYMSCHKRFALSRSYFLIHNGSAEMHGTYEQVAAQMEEYNRKIQELATFVLAHSKITVDILSECLSGEWYINPTQAIEYGFCDKVINDIDEVL